jgi:aerotaxis receptor
MEEMQHNLAAQEAKFDLDELFFSITDLESRILSGNDTFVRISGYSRQELIGAYHNIVRHFDMPRTVFKLFWNYIQNGKPVVAFVKNKTKTGEYYWVLAAVFPLGERYVSIRIKPQSKLFDAVRELYVRLIMAEAKLDTEACDSYLNELLRNNGFENYDRFMHEALVTELIERKKALQNLRHKQALLKADDSCFASIIGTIYQTTDSLLEHYNKRFETVEVFNGIKTMFEEKSLSLSALARDIVFLSLNASVASYKLEENGETFAVLASDIRTNAKENDELIASIDANAQNLAGQLNAIIFIVSSISLQIETVNYFIKELIVNKTKVCDEELRLNIDSLFELVSIYNEKLEFLPYEVEKLLHKTVTLLDALEQQIMYLGYVQIYGIIESSRNAEDSLGFGNIFSQLKELIRKTESEITMMRKVNDEFSKDNAKMAKESLSVKARLHYLSEKIKELEAMEC